MKINRISLLLCAALAAAASSPLPVAAVRALDRYVEIKQPDGSVISIKRCGDEFSHFSISSDGYLLAEEEDSFYYGKILENGRVASTGIPVTADGLRHSIQNQDLTFVTPDLARSIHRANISQRKQKIAQSGMGRFRTNFPTEGDIKSVVILVSYQDVDFNVEDPYGYFNGLLNTDGFDQYSATGCVAEYFRFNSNNKFRPEFTVLGPVVLPYPRSYYGSNTSSGNDKNAYQMVVHAVEQLDPTVDFSQFDMDHDGTVDNVYLIYAGEGEASGGVASSVWPHSWLLSAAGTSLEADGVKIDGYGCSNEWLEGRPDGMGTFTHEFSHVIGLPDLYSTTYGNSLYATPGAWSVMDYGPYLNDGHTPPNFSSYERLALGWIEPRVITGPDNISLENLADSNQACLIAASHQTEYFLFENRQQRGWDAYLPGSGMLIWHVDYIKSVFETNQLNNDRRHMCVELMKASNVADATFDGITEGWCWPGPTGKTEFTDDTEPSMTAWTGERLNLPITEISHSDGLVTFKVAEGRDPILAPEVLSPENYGDGWFEAHWKPSAGASDYLLTVMEKKTIEPDRLIIADMGSEAELILPEGWESSTVAVYSTSGNYGKAAPALKMSADNSHLITPLFDKDVSSVSFWYKGINCDGAIEISGIDEAGNSMVLASITPAKQGGHTETIDNLPSGIRQIIFTFKKNTGNIALDDVEITVSGSEIKPMESYVRRPTQGATTFRVEYPESQATSYLYFVEAIDGEFLSRPSATVEVKAITNGLEAISSDKVSFEIVGRTIHVKEITEVFDLTGRCLFNGSGSYDLPYSGVFILRQADCATKLIVR